MTAEVVEEAEVREIPEPTRALQTHVFAGTAAIALMADDEFERNLAALELARTRADRIKRALMKEGTDYGTVKGIDRPFLHKPGAETLDRAFALAVRFEVHRVAGDGQTEPPYAFVVDGFAHMGSFDGPVVAQGSGEANPWEERYRYRNAERVCPNCGQPAVIKGKEEYGGGWLCWPKRGGCNTKWPDGDKAIEGQSVGKVENPDPWGLANTILKMAVKRAHVDTTLRATGTSGMFTQDDDSPSVKSEAGLPVDTETGEILRGQPVSQTTPSVTRQEGGLVGVASLGKSRPVDGEMRPTPEGPSIGFVIGSGRDRVQVVAYGDLAETLEPFLPAMTGGTEEPGQRVQVWGTTTRETTTVKGHQVTFNRVRLERIQTPDFVLPANEPVDPPSVPIWDDIEADLAAATP